jgi:hypothetical protein
MTLKQRRYGAWALFALTFLESMKRLRDSTGFAAQAKLERQRERSLAGWTGLE